MDYKNKLVLIVEDHDGVRMATKNILMSYGFSGESILEATNGNEGLGVFKKYRSLDLVITDTEMPNRGDGPQMMKSLRDAGYQGPIIQMSGRDQDLSHLGKNDVFIPKGNFAELFAAIENSMASKPEAERKPETKTRILVVEDDDDIRLGLVGRLSSLGYDVDEAEDGFDAREKVERSDLPYQVIISDLWMPRLNGDGLLKKLRDDFNYKGGFIAMTAGVGEDYHRSAYAGINPPPDAYLAKPYEAGELIKVVQKVIADHAGHVVKSDSETGAGGTSFVPGELHI